MSARWHPGWAAETRCGEEGTYHIGGRQVGEKTFSAFMAIISATNKQIAGLENAAARRIAELLDAAEQMAGGDA